MNGLDPHQPREAAIQDERLLGLRDECNIPHCREWESSTGRLLYSEALKQWMVELRCPDHGPSTAWRPEWQPLIDAVLASRTQDDRT